MNRNMLVIIGLIALLALAGRVTANSPHAHFAPQRGELSLRGTATGTWMKFIKVYDAALYAPIEARPSQVLSAPIPLVLEIRYRVDVRRDQLVEAAMTALERQHDSQSLARYERETQVLHSAYRDVTQGDRFRLELWPETGVALFFNDERVASINDAGFAAFYLGIWLGEPPLSDAVRQSLLDWKQPSGAEFALNQP